MKNISLIKRRNFIKAAIVASTAICLAIWFNWQKGPKWKKFPLMVPNMLSGFCSEDTLRLIGTTYLKASPAQNSKDKLQELISSGISKNLLESTEYNEISRQLEIKAEQDFITGDIVIIRGWILSKTEAYQCALMSLS